MSSAAVDPVAGNAKNAATSRATFLTCKICDGRRIGHWIAGRPPAPTTKLRITLWRRRRRWRRRWTLIQIRGRRRRRAEIKLHGRRFLRSGLRGKERFRLKSKHFVQHVRGECTERGVVLLHGAVEIISLYRNAILRSLELRLKTEKILVSF